MAGASIKEHDSGSDEISDTVTVECKFGLYMITYLVKKSYYPTISFLAFLF
jgi:hypothetical protein